MLFHSLESLLIGVQATHHEICPSISCKAFNMGWKASSPRNRSSVCGGLCYRVDSSIAADAEALGKATKHDWKLGKGLPKSRSGRSTCHNLTDSASHSFRWKPRDGRTGRHVCVLDLYRSLVPRYDTKDARPSLAILGP